MTARTYAWRHLITGDIRYYGRNRRWRALVRSVAWRIAGWDSETCQYCGRRYSWSNWISATSIYEKVKGNRGGQMCPRCFSGLAKAKGIKIIWTPVIEHSRQTHGEIMDGVCLCTPIESEEGQ
jgi:hypothetical protein